MSDWIGLGFFILLIAGIFFGLRALGRPRARTEAEFEKGAAESASLLSAGINALNGMLNPGEAKGKEAITEVKKGRYNKRQGKGKLIGEEEGKNDE
jgi:hypothetical protein